MITRASKVYFGEHILTETFVKYTKKKTQKNEKFTLYALIKEKA